MIVEERLVAYLHSLETENSEILEQIEKEALDTGVPIIRKEMQSFLKVLLRMKRPLHLLEVGTAVGFSAILMSEYVPEECKITTIENYEKRIPIARENFKRAGKEDQITLIEGDAFEVLKTLQGPYDFIFMDAAKGQYPFVFDMIRPLIEHDTVVCADNVLFRGYVIDGRHCPHRMRTIQHRLQKFLGMVSEPEWHTAVFRSGDGISVSARKGTQVADCIENIGD